MNKTCLCFALILTVLGVSSADAQELTRDQKIEQLERIRTKTLELAKGLDLPEQADQQAAQAEGLNAIRLLPREKYDKLIGIRGGGAYYSFFHRTNEYGRGSDISLEQGQFAVGFAGVAYGFMADLGTVSIERAIDHPALTFFADYKPPSREPELRAEYRRFEKVAVGDLNVQRRVPVKVGHTYLLRSIDVETSDLLVLFKVHRQDSDGSVVLFCKELKRFDQPIFLRRSDDEMSAEIAQYLQQKGFRNVQFTVKDNKVSVSGSVPREHYAEVIRSIMEFGPRGIDNQLKREQ